MKRPRKAHHTNFVTIATSDKDKPEYEKLRKGLIKALKKFGGYEPDVDEILVDQIASSSIYWKNCEIFLDSNTATELTYTRIADSKMKFQKMIDDSLRELALTRRDRLTQQDQTDLMKQLRETLLKWKKK